MSFCPDCGKLNNDGAKFCGDCGAILIDIHLPVEKTLETDVLPPEVIPAPNSEVNSIRQPDLQSDSPSTESVSKDSTQDSSHMSTQAAPEQVLNTKEKRKSFRALSIIITAAVLLVSFIALSLLNPSLLKLRASYGKNSVEQTVAGVSLEDAASSEQSDPVPVSLSPNEMNEKLLTMINPMPDDLTRLYEIEPYDCNDGSTVYHLRQNGDFIGVLQYYSPGNNLVSGDTKAANVDLFIDYDKNTNQSRISELKEKFIYLSGALICVAENRLDSESFSEIVNSDSFLNAIDSSIDSMTQSEYSYSSGSKYQIVFGNLYYDMDADLSGFFMHFRAPLYNEDTLNYSPPSEHQFIPDEVNAEIIALLDQVLKKSGNLSIKLQDSVYVVSFPDKKSFCEIYYFNDDGRATGDQPSFSVNITAFCKSDLSKEDARKTNEYFKLISCAAFCVTQDIDDVEGFEEVLNSDEDFVNAYDKCVNDGTSSDFYRNSILYRFQYQPPEYETYVLSFQFY